MGIKPTHHGVNPVPCVLASPPVPQGHRNADVQALGHGVDIGARDYGSPSCRALGHQSSSSTCASVQGHASGKSVNGRSIARAAKRRACR
jgi:hypothetical protein